MTKHLSGCRVLCAIIIWIGSIFACDIVLCTTLQTSLFAIVKPIYSICDKFITHPDCVVIIWPSKVIIQMDVFLDHGLISDTERFLLFVTSLVSKRNFLCLGTFNLFRLIKIFTITIHQVEAPSHICVTAIFDLSVVFFFLTEVIQEETHIDFWLILQLACKKEVLSRPCCQSHQEQQLHTVLEKLLGFWVSILWAVLLIWTKDDFSKLAQLSVKIELIRWVVWLELSRLETRQNLNCFTNLELEERRVGDHCHQCSVVRDLWAQLNLACIGTEFRLCDCFKVNCRRSLTLLLLEYSNHDGHL